MSFHNPFDIGIPGADTGCPCSSWFMNDSLINRPRDLLLSADGIRVCVPHLPGEAWTILTHQELKLLQV